MVEIAAELKVRNYTVELLRSDGAPQPFGSPQTFIQRAGKPGPVRSSLQGATGPTSIAFQRAVTSKKWEIWNGIEFVGRSDGTHEIDVAIVPRELGEFLRTQPSGGRPFGHGRVSIECKDKHTNGGPDEMREFVARI